ncbi:hypothetical protein CW304_30190 [Bacillus sp. UFRGS-B20]|nr:hypothetical protein CW304_30190 [Bacillus sp. UFRGS-B20]
MIDFYEKNRVEYLVPHGELGLLFPKRNTGAPSAAKKKLTKYFHEVECRKEKRIIICIQHQKNVTYFWLCKHIQAIYDFLL